MKRFTPYAAMYAAVSIAGGALIAFVIFVFSGPFNIMNLNLGDRTALIFDSGLSLLFFIQHSLMIRKSFRRKFTRFMPEAYFGAFYAVASGLILLVVMFLWQPTDYSFGRAHGMLYWTLRLLFLTALGGFYWGSSALGFFDPFGKRAILNRLRSKKTKPMPFTAKGPYRWVRHPLYFFTLILIWTGPHLTADRLLFNILWSVWLVAGSLLEERDLIDAFGSQYRQYQLKVPMLIPFKQIRQ